MFGKRADGIDLASCFADNDGASGASRAEK
jgi:hypothetical protein